MDQIVANQIGHQTRFPSLELGMEDSRQAGDCDSGYSCAYTNNLAWKSKTQPLPSVLDQRVLRTPLRRRRRPDTGSPCAAQSVSTQYFGFRNQ